MHYLRAITAGGGRGWKKIFEEIPPAPFCKGGDRMTLLHCIGVVEREQQQGVATPC
jgi:hypothetical protein